jgi:hypothetical protein
VLGKRFIVAVNTAVARGSSPPAHTLLTYPGLWPCIVGGQPSPDDPFERSRAQTTCEMLCDATEASLDSRARRAVQQRSAAGRTGPGGHWRVALDQQRRSPNTQSGIHDSAASDRIPFQAVEPHADKPS